MNYTEQELEEAKAFLRDRLRNEQSMSADVLRLLELYAGFLLTALFGNAPENEIELLIQDLIEELLSDVELLAVDEHDRKDAILLYMNSERHGDTLKGRVDKRCHTFFNEVFAVYMAGKLLNKGYNVLLNSITTNLTKPWQNEILVEVRDKIDKGELSSDFDFSERHYGQGNAISSLTALDTMTRYAIADAWQYWRWLDEKENGAKGYFRIRMSSYDCPLCDSLCGIFYPITDEEHMNLAHSNCCCAIIYSYVERL